MNESAQEEKRGLRRIMLEKRRSLPSASTAVWSEQISAQLYSWKVYLDSKTVMLYLAMPEEPPTEPLIQDALRRGKRVCVPLLGKRYGEMTAAEITNLDNLVTGRLGLKMPDPAKAKIADAATIDLVVVPAVAFDYTGNRLGMGAGYYDRFLAAAKNSVFVGMVWACQLTDIVPCEEHDVRMHYLLTENGILPARS